MATTPINGIDSLSASRLDKDKKAEKSLGQDAFLELMITQLKNQDPTNPMQNGEFLSQMAQFGTVSGINNLEKSFGALATSLQSNQALQASTMVGRTVQVESAKLRLPETGDKSFAVELAEPVRAMRITVKDDAGATVRTFNHGDLTKTDRLLKAGEHDITWDGLDADGKRAKPGIYTITAASIDEAGSTALTTLMNAPVESVSLPRNGQPPILNVADFGPMKLEDIRRVR